MVRSGERIHIMGIAGSGAAGAAVLAARAGAIVTGCDLGGPTAYTPQLDAAGVRWGSGHDPEHLAGIDRLAVSAALRTVPDLPELTAARARDLPIVSWQDLIGELMGEGSGPRVAVAGTHGKSTVTALLGHLLTAAGADPTVLVGAMLNEWGGSVRSGRGEVFVVEADEYAGNFLPYHPSLTTLTTIEMDHPDVFADETAVIGMFETFVRGMSGSAPRLVLPAIDPGVLQLVSRLGDWHGEIVRYGPGSESEAQDVTLDTDGIRFTLNGHRFATPLYGAHNVLNATAGLVTARELGLDLGALVEPLATFQGVARRLELIADTAGVLVFDDYAHHPTEVRAALSGARQRVGSRRLWAIIEPHTHARTRAMFDDYALAFGQADEVVVADVFAARDTDTSSPSPEDLADAIERTSAVPAMATGSVDETAAYVAEHVVAGDAVVTLGIGTSYRIARSIADALALRQEPA
jgi:UDP-N-acetylmuramate--alanine ligase